MTNTTVLEVENPILKKVCIPDAYNCIEQLKFYIFIIIISGLTYLAVYLTYKFLWMPDIYIKELTEVGFKHLGNGPDRLLKINRAQTARRLGTKLPPPYPNGWFAVAESDQLGTKGVLSVDALGQNLCVYRSEDGKARCVDAYCPHLGANLAIGGTVCGDCIECPFHQWRFGSDGHLVSVPGIDKAPNVSIKSWQTAEADGAVWIWHHAEGLSPWPLEDAEELRSWKLRGRNEFTVSCHIQEIPENGADVAHLNAVHSSSLLFGLGHHHWTAEWAKGDDHTANLKLTHDFKIGKINLVHLDVDVTQIGPGHVRLLMKSPLGPLLVSQSVTPLGPLTQKVVHRIFSAGHNALFGRAMNRAESHMIERDIKIWNNKKFVSSPTYVKTDKSIKAYRTWYSQFYSENSVPFRDAVQNTLEW